MKKGYERFLKKSGLTPDEAYDFIVMKLKKFYPDDEDMAKEFDMTVILDDFEKEFINYLAKEAKKWGKNRVNA
jgi:hypothetical protein